MRDAIRQTFYSPLELFEPVSHLLAELLKGGHSLLFQSPSATTPSKGASCSPEDPLVYNWWPEAALGVLCGDSAGKVGVRDEAWAARELDSLVSNFPMFGDPWARNVLSCAHWPFKPKFAFHGPFGSPRSPKRRGDKKVDNSTAPLLILSNRYDNATPLKNARKVSESFAGSSLVVQEAWGHCALVVSSSKCLAKIIQEYFNHGTVPQTETVCEPDCLPGIPFKPCPGFSE